MTQEEISALLGRPLTPVEVTNFDLYLEIAEERLSDLLCVSFTVVTEDRTFDIRENYRTVMLNVFTDINSVENDGEAVTDYTKYQWDKRNASWFNSIVLDTCLPGPLTINADWGIAPLPVDVQLLLAKLFALVSRMNAGNGNVKSKKVEDFHITFSDHTEYQQFLLDNQATIDKYSLCGEVTVQHGRVSNLYYN